MKTNLFSNWLLKTYRLFFIFFLALSSFNSTASDYFWVGNSGNWSDLSHWATSSGGTVMQTQLPTTNDNVFFDANSFTLPGQVVHFDQVSMFTHDMNWTGVANTPACDGIIGNKMYISGSLNFVTDMNMNFAGGFYFTATSTGQTIVTAGKVLLGVIFNGAGGEWTLQDALTTNSGLLLSTGTLNTNDQTVTTASVNLNASFPGTLNMGASVFNITGINAWVGGNGSIIVNSGTSVINCSYHGAIFNPSYPAVTSFYDVNFLDSANIYKTSNFHNVSFHVNGNIVSSNSFNDLNLTAGYSYKLGGPIQTINGSLNASGTCSSPTSIKCTTANSYTTISHPSGAVNVSYVQLTGIHAAGGATFTANNSVDLYNNNGWVFNNTLENLYWVGNGGNWSDGNHWSYTSGGAPAGCHPFAWTDIHFDENSFSAPAQVVTIDISNPACRNMDWTGVTNTPSFNYGASIYNNLAVGGSIHFVTAMILHIAAFIRLVATTPGQTITTGGQIMGPVSFSGGANAEWALQDDYTSNSFFTLVTGTVNSNNHTINAREFSAIGGPITFNAGSSVINLFNREAWSSSSSAFTINCPACVINCTNDTAIFFNSTDPGGLYYPKRFYDVNFTGLGQGNLVAKIDTFHNVTFAAGATIGIGIIHKAVLHGDGILSGGYYGSPLYGSFFDSLYFSAGKTYKMQAHSVQTINNDWLVQGTCTNNIILKSDTAGVFATFSKPADSVRANYLQVTDIHTSGGAVFMAYNSLDLGGNAGWNFTASAPLESPGAIDGPSSVCSAATGIVFQIAAVNGATQYNWTVPPGATIVSGQGSTSIVVDFGTAVSGDITVQSFNGCIYGATPGNITITVAPVPPAPTVALAPDITTSVCPGTAITFTATAGNTGSSAVTYDFKVNGTSVQDGNSNTYTTSTLQDGDAVMCIITVSTNGCFTGAVVSSNIISVNILPASTPTVTLDADPGTTFCQPTTVSFTATATGIGTGTVNYDFKVNGISLQNSSSGTYTSMISNTTVVSCDITVTGTSCYTSTTASSNVITITIDPGSGNVQVHAGTDATIVAGQTLQLNASGDAGTYLWAPPTGLSAINVLDPVASPTVTTTYTLMITTVMGCIGSDEIKIEVKDSPTTDCILEPMNAITPNGDGINDRWIAWQGSCIAYASVTVFNRYGTLVFQSAHYQNDWEGTYKGKPLPDGTYYTITTYRLNNEQTIIKRNDLTILR